MGAAIAAGNQLEKGICALLVMPAIIMNRHVMRLIEWCDMDKISQWP